MNWLTLVLAARDDAADFVRSVEGADEYTVALPASDVLGWANLEVAQEADLVLETAYLAVGPLRELEETLANLPVSDALVESFTVALPVGEDRVVYLPDDLDEVNQTVQLFAPVAARDRSRGGVGRVQGPRCGIPRPRPAGRSTPIALSTDNEDPPCQGPQEDCDCAPASFSRPAGSVLKRLLPKPRIAAPSAQGCWCEQHQSR